MLQDLRQSLKSEGMTIHPIKTRAPYLRGCDLNSEVVVDVGVAGATPWLSRTFPDARFLLIGPQKDCGNAVRANGVLQDFHFRAVSLKAMEGRADLMIPHSKEGEEIDMASLRRRTDWLPKSFVKTENINAPARPLDDLTLGCDGRAFLKIDAAVPKVEVLAGARETLKRCCFVILEFSFSPRFTGVGLPSKAVSFLAKAGLELRDVLHIAAGAGKGARPRYMDFLFTRWTA